MRLCHSRMFYVRAYPRESQEMVFDAHDRAFAFYGGVCRRGIYDNMKTAVDTVFVAPVELVGLARIKPQRHKGLDREPGPLRAPRPDEAVHAVVRAVVTAS